MATSLRARCGSHDARTILDVLAARATAEEIAYLFLPESTSSNQTQWTFRDVAARSAAFAAHLSLRGIRRGSRVVLAVIKDLLIVDGRNHFPDDIEATVGEIIEGRAAAISVTQDEREKLVVIAEFMPAAIAPAEVDREMATVRSGVTAAISTAHSIRLAELVLVAPASLPVTTSGKVKRSACAQLYRRGELMLSDG